MFACFGVFLFFFSLGVCCGLVSCWFPFSCLSRCRCASVVGSVVACACRLCSVCGCCPVAVAFLLAVVFGRGRCCWVRLSPRRCCVCRRLVWLGWVPVCGAWLCGWRLGRVCSGCRAAVSGGCCAVACFAASGGLGSGLVVGGVVAFAGSRSLGAAFAPLVSSAVGSVLRSGRSVSVGCCVGADVAVLSALCAASPRSGLCFAAFGAGGVGSCSLSAVSAVSGFAAAGGSVSWWSGGGSSVALPVRLSARTSAVVAAASVSCVVFFSSPASVGSLLACRLAVGRGLPVFAFPCGFAGSLLPSLGAGSWVCVGGSGVWAGSFRWVSSQCFLF